jgi:hypothetical protein
MQRIGIERDLSQKAAPGIVLALEVALQHQTTVAHDDDTMEVPHAFFCDGLVEACLKIGCEAYFARRNRKPIGHGSRGRSD